MRYLLALVVPFVTSLTILLAGCSKEPTPEEKHADSTLVLAKAQLGKGKHREGRQLLHSALSIDLRLNRPRPLAEEYDLLGRLSVNSAELDSAPGYFTKAIEQYKSLTDRTNARALLLELASLHRQMGEERIAYDMYAEALRLAAIFNDVDGTREIQLAMLPGLRALEKTEEHAEAINALLRVYIESGNQRMQARVHFESALSFIQRSDFVQATDLLLRALTLADQAKDSLFVINILSTLAATYHQSGNTQQSFETYTDALTRADHTAAAQGLRLEMLIRVGNVYLHDSQFPDAGRFYRAALGSAVNLKNRLAEGYLFIQIGYCALAEGRVDEALKGMQNAFDLFAAAGYAPGLAFANAGMAATSQRSGRSNDAVNYFKAAIEQKELCSQQSSDVYSECEDISLHNLSNYDSLIELLLQTGHTDDAFWYAERYAEHALYKKLVALDLHTRNDLVNTLFARFRHAQALHTGAERQLAIMLALGPESKSLCEDIQAQIKKAENASQDIAAGIIRTDPNLKPAVQFNGMSIAEAQGHLPAGSVLLRSIPTNRSVYSFAMTSSTVTLQLAAVERQHLESYCVEYNATVHQLEALTDSPAVQRRPLEQRLQELSTPLYAALIRPVENVLAGAANVLVVPHPELSLLPMQALRKGGSGTPYCIEQFPITYLPTLAMLGYHSAPATHARDIVGMGYAGTTTWDVEYELRDIRAFYKDARLYFGQQASFATLQREHGDVLHLAVDMRYSTRSPENAYIILSDAKTRGIAKDALWGDLLKIAPFPAVVLSHLHADSISIDQLLPSLFLINGSSTVIANTLPASRKSKKFFGEIFYTALLAGNTAESAFRQAMLEMIKNKEYASPFVWGPFSLWGK